MHVKHPQRPHLKPLLISLTGLCVGATGALVPLAATAAPTHDSQIVEGNAFMSNGYVELGSRPNGSFGSDVDAPAGYHPLSESGDILGFRADRDKDGWGVGVDDGDFFTPGTPLERWAIRVDENSFRSNDSFGTAIPGSHSGPASGSSGTSVTWSSDAPVDGVSVSQVVTIPAGSRLVHVDVTLTNTTANALGNVRYIREVDPDNCRMRTEDVCDHDGDGVADGPGSYATWNTIVGQKADGDPASIVSADQTDGSYFDLRTTAAGSEAIVKDWAVGRTARRCAEGASCATAEPKGTRTFGDDLIRVSVDTANLAPGASRNFRVSYVLNEDEAAPVPPAQPTVGSVHTRARMVIGGAHRVPVTCRTRGADLDRCKLTLTARKGGKSVVIGRKTGNFAAADVRRAVVRVPLNRRGRALVHRLGGVNVKVTGVIRAADSSGPVTRTDRIRLLPRQVRLDPVLFDVSSARVDKPYRAYLTRISKRLAYVRLIRITGHTDNDGTPADNFKLGLDRAKAVRAILAQGHRRIKTDVFSRGESAPVASNGTARGRAQNRRAIVVIRY